MQPQLAPTIDKATRRQYPQGIAAHGTDALRFTFAALAAPSREIRFDLARVGGYRNFCNKLWNAARFVTLALGEYAPQAQQPLQLSIADRWIRARFGRMLGTLERALADYRFDYLANALYEFTWYDFCDWYLELTKPLLQADSVSAAARRGTQHTLAQILEALQRALHPLMPFITEEIWQRVAPLAGMSGPSVMLQPYPVAADFPADEEAEREVAWVQAFVLAVRQIRGEMNISPGRRIPVLLKGARAEDERLLARHRAWLERLAGLESLTLLGPEAAAPQAAVALLGALTILVPMAGLIDASAEAERLGKLLARAESDLAKTRGRLANAEFVRGAPPAVVATERQRAQELERTASGLAAQLERVRGLAASGAPRSSRPIRTPWRRRSPRSSRSFSASRSRSACVWRASWRAGTCSSRTSPGSARPRSRMRSRTCSAWYGSACSSPATCYRRTSSAYRCSTAPARNSTSVAVRSSPSCCSPMRSTVRARALRARCSRRWRNGR
jgi:valyl-tRNA synthetase